MVPVLEPPEELDGVLGRGPAASGLHGAFGVDSGFKLLAERLGEIGHLLKIEGPALINVDEYLVGSETRFPQAFEKSPQLRSGEVEKGQSIIQVHPGRIGPLSCKSTVDPSSKKVEGAQVLSSRSGLLPIILAVFKRVGAKGTPLLMCSGRNVPVVEGLPSLVIPEFHRRWRFWRSPPSPEGFYGSPRSISK